MGGLGFAVVVPFVFGGVVVVWVALAVVVAVGVAVAVEVWGRSMNAAMMRVGYER